MRKVIIIVGSILAATGMACFLALLGGSQPQSIRALGSACFTSGVLVIALGVFLQARQLQGLHRPPISKSKKKERLCLMCNQEPSLLFCRVHVVHLCVSCFEKHDDGSHCSFVPSKRAALAHK